MTANLRLMQIEGDVVQYTKCRKNSVGVGFLEELIALLYLY